ITMKAAVRAFIRAYNERSGATVILTSHYMEDVAALCPRVIVINHGKLTYDGALDALVRETRPEKRLTLRLARAVEREDLEGLGARLVALEDENAVLQVDAATMRGVVAAALAAMPVLDLKIEEAPLEEVMADLFKVRGSEAPPDTPPTGAA